MKVEKIVLPSMDIFLEEYPSLPYSFNYTQNESVKTIISQFLYDFNHNTKNNPKPKEDININPAYSQQTISNDISNSNIKLTNCQETSSPEVQDLKRKKRQFTIEEDKAIIEHVQRNGPHNWLFLAKQLDGRSAKQCRERWHSFLDPQNSNRPWALHEDQILFEKQKQFGNKWALIARCLPGRSDTAVKNRWNTTVKFWSSRLLR